LWSGEEKQLITQPITEPQTAVDVSGLPSGVYFVKVVDDGEGGGRVRKDVAM